MAKVLIVDPEKCNGCRKCEMVCSVKHQGISNPALSRIRVIQWEKEGFYLPMHCQHCQNPPCMAVCPREAIYQGRRAEPRACRLRPMHQLQDVRFGLSLRRHAIQ